MKTSCFSRYTGEKGVAICVYPPIDWVGANFPVLEPDRQTLYAIKDGTIDEKEYERLYRIKLEKLNAQNIYDQLKDSVLLCWEQPRFFANGKINNSGSGFCHRHLISSWFFEKLGIEIEEWKLSDEKIKIKNKNPLF
jgi:hypothetical protein